MVATRRFLLYAASLLCGAGALAVLLENLCRHTSRSDADWGLIDSAMRCVKAIINTAPGLEAVAANQQILSAFAAGGGSLLLCDRESPMSTSVDVLCAVAVFSDSGHDRVRLPRPPGRHSLP